MYNIYIIGENIELEMSEPFKKIHFQKYAFDIAIIAHHIACSF